MPQKSPSSPNRTPPIWRKTLSKFKMVLTAPPCRRLVAWGDCAPSRLVEHFGGIEGVPFSLFDQSKLLFLGELRPWWWDSFYNENANIGTQPVSGFGKGISWYLFSIKVERAGWGNLILFYIVSYYLILSYILSYIFLYSIKFKVERAGWGNLIVVLLRSCLQ